MWKLQLPNGGEIIANNVENREKLARDMVDSWDFNTLVGFAVDSIEENLANCENKDFDGEWKQFYGED